jgi:flagellar basal-body rod protein FlgF
MDALTSAAASGMRSRLESLDMLANNIANSSAPGFKADREFYNLYRSSEAADSSATTPPPTLPVIERQWTDFAQGVLTPTNNSLDLALNGDGFFVAGSPSGHIFTRNGSFHLSSQGQLETPDGHAVLDQNGNPIVLDSSRPVEITTQGVVNQDGQDVAQLGVVSFKDTSTLTKRGSAYFAVDLSAITPDPSAAEVLQGQLESANSQPAESAIRLVSVLRQFESLQKAMTIGSEMNRLAVQEVAKATS